MRCWSIRWLCLICRVAWLFPCPAWFARARLDFQVVLVQRYLDQLDYLVQLVVLYLLPVVLRLLLVVLRLLLD
ncbi:hypothetical protein ACVPOQ_04860 [Staphylococcus aureus]